MTADSTALEILVAKIQQSLAPGAKVLHNVRLPGRKSRRERQIDVLVRHQIGQYELLIAVDCKDYAKPVDVKGVEEFWGLLDDVGANKGALVCPRGFSTAAKERAAGLGIDLYSPIDTDPHKWQAKVAAPALCDFRDAHISFRLSCSQPKPLTLRQDFYQSVTAYSRLDRRPLGVPLTIAFDRWEAGEFPTDPGVYENLTIFDEPEVLIDNGHDDLVLVTLAASLLVEQRLYFGHIPLQETSGFWNEQSGALITRGFTTGFFDPVEIQRNWRRIQSEAELPVHPVFRMKGLLGR